MARSISALIAAGLISSCSPEAPTELPNPRTVIVEPVSAFYGNLGFAFPGTVQTTERSEIAFEVGGRVISLDVDLGDTFQRGDALGRVEDTTQRLDIRAREADLASARSTLNEAQLDYQRLAGLDGTGAVSGTAIDQAKVRLDSAQAAVQVLQSQVATARQRLAFTVLRAPFDGEVAFRHVEPSQVVAAGQPIFSVDGADSGFEAQIALPDRNLSQVSVGDAVELTTSANGEILSGQVSEIGVRSNQAGLYPVTIDITADDSVRLTAGMSVEATFVQAANVESALRIPLGGYAIDPDGSTYVFLISPDNQSVVKRPVELGTPNGRSVEVLSGLSPDDLIVVRGADLLNDGELVIPAGVENVRYDD